MSSANPLARSSSRKRAEILAPSHALGDVVEAMPGRRLHQLEILLVLRGGAGGDLIEKIAGVAGIGAAEFREGSEEMVMPGHALGRDEAAHGEGIDQGIVEVLVLGDFGGGNIARLADRLGRGSRLDRLRLGERLGGLIDAETVFTPDADERLGVDGAVQMIVQVGALRHALEEVAQGKRVGADLLQLLRGALFGSWRRLGRRSGRDLGQSEGGDEQKKGKGDRAGFWESSDAKPAHGPPSVRLQFSLAQEGRGFQVRPASAFDLGLEERLSRRPKLHEQMADVLMGLLGHAVRHDQPVAVLRLALQAEQADGLRLPRARPPRQDRAAPRARPYARGRCARSLPRLRPEPRRARASGCRARANGDRRCPPRKDAPRADAWRSPSCARRAPRGCRARARSRPAAACG